MSPEALFSLASGLVVPGWFLLLVAPRWKWSARLIGAVILPLVLAAGYLYLIARYMPGAKGGFGSLQEVRDFFESPYLLLAGWIHYLAFDLFIGSWEVREAQRLGISHWLVVPCLILTFLLGPIGLLLFLALRAGIRKRVALEL